MTRYSSFSNEVRFILLLLGFLLFFLLGCDPAKKAQRQVDKAILEYPQIAATELRKAFPCIETPIKFITDSAGYKLWKDSVDKINAFYNDILNNIQPIIKVDSFPVQDSCNQLLRNIEGYKSIIYQKNEQIKKLNLAISNVVPVRDTLKVFVKDSAAEQIIISQTQDINDLKLSGAKSKGRGDKWFWIAMGLLVIIGVGIYLKVKKMFTKVVP